MAKAIPPLLFWIKRVKAKLASGEYQTEEVPCFCGSTYSHQLTKKDRYGFDHCMNLCIDCGLIYTSPRMTEESYRHFYENEYRHIYDLESQEEAYKFDKINGQNLITFLNHYEIYPKKVLDIGCNMGGMLAPFKEKGIEVLGVEINHQQADYGEHEGIPIFTGSLDEFNGGEYDLIILHHVLEHFSDLSGELEKIKKLLKKEGYLYVGVPGLYGGKLIHGLLQNAHTYQFTATTLGYVLGSCGFEEIYCDENIISLWQYAGDAMGLPSKPEDEASCILSHLVDPTKVKTIKTVSKFPMGKRKENMDYAFSCGYEDASVLVGKHKDGKALIIGGGPSVDGYVEKIWELRKQGYIVFSIERMYNWCLDHGIVPDYVVVLDASDDVVESFDNIHSDVTHLIATQCNKDVLDRLKDSKAYIFTTPQKGINYSDYWHKYGYKKAAVINAGGSVTMGCITLSMTLGCRDLAIFGFDCHIPEKQYANGITGVGEQKHTYDIKVDDRTFTVTNAYLSFAQQFFILHEIAKNQDAVDRVRVYGDSLIKALAKTDEYEPGGDE